MGAPLPRPTWRIGGPTRRSSAIGGGGSGVTSLVAFAGGGGGADRPVRPSGPDAPAGSPVTGPMVTGIKQAALVLARETGLRDVAPADVRELAVRGLVRVVLPGILY